MTDYDALQTQCITQKSTTPATRAVQDAMSIQQQMIARGQPDDSALMSAQLLTTTLEFAVYDGGSPPSPSPGQPDTEQVQPLPAPSPEPPLPSRPTAMGCATTQGRTIDDDSLLALAVAESRLINRGGDRSPPPPLQLTASTSPTRSTPPTPLPRVSNILNVPIVPFSLPLVSLSFLSHILIFFTPFLVLGIETKKRRSQRNAFVAVPFVVLDQFFVD
jgi:hypothetical protein